VEPKNAKLELAAYTIAGGIIVRYELYD